MYRDSDSHVFTPFSVTFSDASIYDDSIDPERDLICMSSNYVPETLPSHPFIFTSDIYKLNMLPKNIMRTVSDNAVNNPIHMSDWNHTQFTSSQQKDFITRYFPEKINMYKKYTYDRERTHLFIYLWLYLNGGIYIDSEYELNKSLEPILDESADLYFVYDEDRYISPKFLASRPFSTFWLDVIDIMKKRQKSRYSSNEIQIDKNSGRSLLTDVLDETLHKYIIIPRPELYPYTECDTVYDKNSYLVPSNRNKNVVTYISCRTGNSTEVVYITGAVTFVIIIMVVIALITN